MTKNFILFFIIVLSILDFSLSQNCIDGQNLCTKCNIETDLCSLCQYNFLIPDDKGSCKINEICTVGKNYCQKCDSEYKLCQKCIEGFFPDQSGGCSYSQKCEISYYGQCIKCTENYFLIEDIKICKSESSDDFFNCLQIDYSTGFCEKCEEGYYLTSGDKKCISSTDNCKESIYGQCVECSDGYYLDQQDKRICKQTYDSNLPLHCLETEDGVTCIKCQLGFYLDEDGNCPYINYCSHSDGYNCTECIKGRYMNAIKSACTTVEKGCYGGDPDSGICLSCEENGYYFDANDHQCKSNRIDGDDLKYCRHFSDKCDTCEIGYEVGEDGRCCNTRYCSQSDNNICQKCREGFYLTSNNFCSYTKNCISIDIYYVCEECEEGFYYNRQTKKCNKYNDENFDNCRITNYNGKSCDGCRKGYYLKKPSNLCINNSEKGKFYMCERTESSGTKCEKCWDEYYLGTKDYLCTKNDHCSTSDENGKCIECENKSFCLDVSDGTCHTNSKVEDKKKSFYYKCLKTNKKGNKCEECVDEELTLDNEGYCRNENACYKKDDGHCEEKCYSVSYLLGFNYCFNQHFGCVKNILNIDCLQCNDDLNFEKCTKCNDGYKSNNEGFCENS